MSWMPSSGSGPEQDRSLVFRHACHHAACGTCGMRVNGREKLTCITLIESVTADGGTVTIEPLRNLPVVSDLLVDMTAFYSKMEQAQFVPVRTAEPMVDVLTRQPVEDQEPAVRFENCIECGICVSACPIPGTGPGLSRPRDVGGDRTHGPGATVRRRRAIARAVGRQRTRSVALPHGL